MSTVRNIAKNTVILLAVQVSSYLLAIVYMIYIARYLGPSDFGVLSFAIAFTNIFQVLTDLGLAGLAARDIARDKKLTTLYLFNISGMKFVLGLITFGLIALVINLMGYPQQTITVVYLLGISVLITSFTYFYYAIYGAYEKMEYTAGLPLNSLIVFIGVILAISYGWNLIGFAAIYVAASTIVLIYNIIILKLNVIGIPPSPKRNTSAFNLRFWKTAILVALPFGLSTIFNTVYNWADSVLLSIIKDSSVVGWYSAAYRMVQALLFIPLALSGATFPVMSRLYRTADESLKLTLEKLIKYLLMIGLPIAVGGMVLAERIIMLIYGPEYEPSVICLQILVWSILLAFMNYIFSYFLYLINRQAILAKMYLAALVFNLALNFAFIPQYSYVAASSARLATEMFLCTGGFILASRAGYNTINKLTLKSSFKVITAGLIMGVFTFFFNNLNLAILVTASACIYLTLILLFGVIDKTDVELVRRLIRGD